MSHIAAACEVSDTPEFELRRAVNVVGIESRPLGYKLKLGGVPPASTLYVSSEALDVPCVHNVQLILMPNGDKFVDVSLFAAGAVSIVVFSVS